MDQVVAVLNVGWGVGLPVAAVASFMNNNTSLSIACGGVYLLSVWGSEVLTMVASSNRGSLKDLVLRFGLTPFTTPVLALADLWQEWFG